MRIQYAHDFRRFAMAKKSVNISMDEDLLAEARRLKLNLSQIIADTVREMVAVRIKAQWYAENAKAIDADRKFLETFGNWNEEFRPW
jgi:antitoxin CcdA